MKIPQGHMGHKILLLLALVVGCLLCLECMPVFAQSATQRSISDLAASYSGELSRALFPETSLGIPFTAQIVISVILSAMMICIALFAPKARHLVMLLTLFVVSRHLVWRGVHTLDWEFNSPISSIIGLILYAGELMAFVALVLNYIQVFEQTDRKSISLQNFSDDQLPSVDVYICTYNEPISVVYRTLVGALSIDYPKKEVWLLDDGNRPEMAELAQKLGSRYIARAENIHAKAGNMNNALKQTTGELILVFDADHVSCKSYLKEVVGFFLDDKLSFVQTPQHFFTPDPFQRNLVSEQVINNEQDLFFHVIEPGNDYWGAAFFGGSGAIFRRSSLDSIGGFAVETITEDVHTGLRLHAKGWKSAYYNKDLSAGLAQDSFADFIKQRVRWSRGMSQILFFDHPLLIKGLNLGQRLSYFAGIFYFFTGWPRLIFLLAPLAFLLFGIKTVNAGFVEMMTYYLPSFICLLLGYTIITRGMRHSFWGEVYETALCFYMSLATLATVISPTRATFKVTPKGTLTEKLSFNWEAVLPQLIIAVLTVIGIGMAIARGLVTPDYSGGIFTNLFWSLYNLILLMGAIYVAQERPQYRLTPRVFKKVRCEVRLLDGSLAVGYTTNISESGMSVVFEEAIPVSGTMNLKMLDWDINETSVFSVQAVRSSLEGSRYYVGFRVVNRSDEQHQKLIRHMFGTPDVWRNYHVYSDTGKSFSTLLATPLRLAQTQEEPSKRRTVRFNATLSAVIMIDNRQILGFSREISESGMSLYVKEIEGLSMGQVVQIQIQWPTNRISDLTAQIARIEDVGDGQFMIGVNFVNLSREGRIALISQIYKPTEGLVRVAPSVQKVSRCTLSNAVGQSTQGVTLEISEIGAVIRLKDKISMRPGDALTLQIHWNNQITETYKVIAKDIAMDPANKVPITLLHFENLDLKAVETLGKYIHEPLEDTAFDILQAM